MSATTTTTCLPSALVETTITTDIYLLQQKQQIFTFYVSDALRILYLDADRWHISFRQILTKTRLTKRSERNIIEGLFA